MILDESANLQRIERDRRRRELLLLLLLLGFTDRALRQARSAVRVGADPVLAAQQAIQGAGPLAPGHVHWRGLYTRALPLIAEAYTAGTVRATKMAGVTLDLPDEPEPIAGVERAAADLADKTAVAVARVVTAAVEEAAQTGVNAAKTVEAIGDAFRAAGLARDNDAALEAAAERVVVTAYGSGLYGAMDLKPMLGRVTGFKYISVLDNRTTTICRAYDGTTLPARDPWWAHHFPACHWRCRAVVLPRFDKFVATVNPPLWPEPMPGFGEAPLIAFNSLVGR